MYATIQQNEMQQNDKFQHHSKLQKNNWLR